MFRLAIHHLAATAVVHCCALRSANSFDITNFFIGFLVLVSPHFCIQHNKQHQEPWVDLPHLTGGPCVIQETARQVGSAVHQTCCGDILSEDIFEYHLGTSTVDCIGNCSCISYFSREAIFESITEEFFAGHYKVEYFQGTCFCTSSVLRIPESKDIVDGFAGIIFEELEYPCHFVDIMAQQSMGAAGTIPLSEYRREVPPGWGPGIPDYPLRAYFEKLRLWYRVFDGMDEVVGPLVAGRLTGRAQKLAINLRLPRPNGGFDVGDEALVRLSVDEVRDPNDPTVILQHHIPSGVQALCNALRDAFGQSDQDMVSRSLESFFEFKRGKLSLQEYAVEWDLRYDEAETRSNLQLNDVAKFYLFFKQSNLPAKFIEDIKLQIHGDLSRFMEARTLALRLSQRGQEDSDNIFYEEQSADGEQQSWQDDEWQDWTDWPDWPGLYYGEQDDGWHDPGDPHDQWWNDWPSMDSYYDQPWDAWQEEHMAESATDNYDHHGQEHEPPSEPPHEDYYKGKGKNAMALGCAICGSKWHSSSACPVNMPNNKGKNYNPGNKGKSYGKYRSPYKGYGNKGKGYGFRPWNSGKGKSKFGNKGYGKKGKRYYAEGDHYYNGYAAERAPLNTSHVRQDAQPATAASGNVNRSTKATYYRMDADDDLIKLSRPSKTTTTTTPDDESGTHDKPDKVLSFAMFLNDNRKVATYHTVKGEKRRGLLIDPGAASGLVGSETLRDIMEHCIPEEQQPDHISWNKKTTSVSGISGEADETLGEVLLKLKTSDRTISYRGDVLGGAGSLCPALVGNPTLRQQQAALFSDWFPGGDGLLAICRKELLGDDQKPILLRLLLTDSGHYLLPTDQQSVEKIPNNTGKKVTFLTQQIIQQSKQLWPDEEPQIKHCFLQYNLSEQAETDRSEQSLVQQEQPAGVVTAGVMDEVCDENPCSSDHPQVAPLDQLADSLNDDHVHTDANKIYGNETTFSATSQNTSCQRLSKPINNQKDVWTVSGQWLIREHKVSRRTLYSPACSKDCPVSLDKLLSERHTEVVYDCDSLGPEVIEDTWQDPQRAHRDLGKPWTGKTWFLMPDDLEQFWLNKRKLDEWMPPYTGDHFPFSEDKKNRDLHHEYRAMPEEFYTKTGRRPVTPANFDQWMQEITQKHRDPSCHFMELYSGTGRLSLTMATAGLSVAFPVDLRYGWNINDPEHQRKLWTAIDTLKPGVIFASPKCKFYSTASNTMHPDKKLEGRLEDEPGQHFLQKVCQHQAHSGRGFVVEQPWGSTMFQDSPVQPQTIAGCRPKQRCDQCMFGAQDELQQPVQKATALMANFKCKKTTKRCGGHKGQQHAHLQGKVGGLNRTSLAAVYPRQMCQALCKDVVGYLKDVQYLNISAWPKSLHYVWHSHFYACPKCKLGKTAPAGTEHTLIPGECRHGRWPTADGRRPNKNESVGSDPVTEWKKEARKHPLNETFLDFPKEFPLAIHQRTYWKAALFQVIQDALAIFSEATDMGVDYKHWITDQVLLAVLRELLDKIMYLKGVKVCLRADTKATPEPQLSKHTAPLRIQVRGTVKMWTMDPVEDLTTCSHRQITATTTTDVWQITMFGKELEEGDKRLDSVAKSAPRTPTTSRASPSTPTTARRALPLPEQEPVPDGILMIHQ